MEDIEHQLCLVLEELGVDVDGDDNFRETPRRFAVWLREHFRAPEETERILQSLKRATFPSANKGMVTFLRLPVGGICSHHLLPVAYQISMAYLPGERVIGLSKPARLARLFGELPILQEDVTERIADGLIEVLATEHVACVVEGRHSCMEIRGARMSGTVVTSAVRGKFKDSYRAKTEFFSMLTRG